MNENRFMKVTSWTDQQLVDFCYKIYRAIGKKPAVFYLLDFRKDLQKALSVYSQQTKVFDMRQMRATQISEQILRYCSGYYKEWAMRELIKKNNKLALDRQKLKGLTNEKWEVFVKTHSY